MLRFYCDAFGFARVGEEHRWDSDPIADETIGVKNSSARVVLLEAANCYIELFEFFSPPSRNAGPAQAYDHGYTHFGVEVTDIEKEFDRLKGLGMTFTAKQPFDLGYAKSIYGRDPDGNIIELQQFADTDARAFGRLACFAGGTGSARKAAP
jgi:catechol 2,3-dioxygenase-like lactoylglutathione lyase family enzyme